MHTGNDADTCGSGAYLVVGYLRSLPAPKLLLWCYLLWYLFVAVTYFDPSPTLWVSSLGLSAIIGTGLYLSTAFAGRERTRLAFWPVLRFYLMPFCVSSFSALIKGHGFVLIFHPTWAKNLEALALCVSFCALAGICRLLPAPVPKRAARSYAERA